MARRRNFDHGRHYPYLNAAHAAMANHPLFNEFRARSLRLGPIETWPEPGVDTEFDLKANNLHAMSEQIEKATGYNPFEEGF